MHCVQRSTFIRALETLINVRLRIVYTGNEWMDKQTEVERQWCQRKTTAIPKCGLNIKTRATMTDVMCLDE